MRDDITFDKIVEETAGRAKVSKSFMHDFIKDMVGHIHTGLQQNGKVNIAQLGKFELQQVDEREGYNPQTEKKMTIPAHKKVVFKPYKGLREAVNAPYAHIETQLLDDKDATADAPTPAENDSKSASIPGQSQHQNKSDRNILGNVTRWISGGVAFAAAIGTWFWLKKDDE